MSGRSFPSRMLTAVAVALLLSARANAQPAGSEFRVNVFTIGAQEMPELAFDASGALVVVWDSDHAAAEGAGTEIYARRYASSGVTLGSEFRVNVVTTGFQYFSAVGTSPSGTFVVVWKSYGQTGIEYEIRGRVLTATGNFVGAEFQVNVQTPAALGAPRVAVEPSGSFVVVWSGYVEDQGIFARRYASSGFPLGDEFRVNPWSQGVEFSPDVAASPAGGFVVVWHSSLGGSDIWSQRFESSGAPAGAAFRVNTFTSGLDDEPRVAFDDAGAFTVVWHGAVMAPGNGGDVLGQRFSRSGTPLGPEFRVNTFTTGDQYEPAIAPDRAGGFVVVWSGDEPDLFSRSVYARRFGPSGAPVGGEFRVNTFTTSFQNDAAVASDPNGNLAVVWSGDEEDGSGSGVFGQRFRPMGLKGDVDGDGARSVTDVLYLINHLFAGGPAPVGHADANEDGLVNVSDVLYLINHLFAGGPAPL